VNEGRLILKFNFFKGFPVFFLFANFSIVQMNVILYLILKENLIKKKFGMNGLLNMR